MTAPADSSTWLLSLDQIQATDFDRVGGKTVRLALLKQQGLAVPPGLAVTTTFFETHLKKSRLIPLWAGSPDVAVTTDSLAWLADTLKTRPIDPELLTALRQAVDARFGPEIQQFAVRSSAIDEDRRDRSFAGIHLTELGVPRAALPIAITRCWASALSGPALQYRLSHGMSIQGIRIAVLIQPMLTPDSSGVGFTVNPLTAARDELVIEATWGLGQPLVEGAVQPFLYRLANQPPDYPLLESRPGHKPAGAAGDAPLPAAALPVLADQLVRIQALMGEPQDVEWAWQDETFYILQSRPIALPEAPPPTIDIEWTRGSHPEFLPDLPSPLFGSILEQSQVQALAFFRRLGLQVDNLGPYVRLILGRPYLNLTLLKRVAAQVGVNAGAVLHTIGYTPGRGHSRSLTFNWEQVWRARGVFRQVLRHTLRASAAVRRYRSLVEQVVQKITPPRTDLSPQELTALFRLHTEVYGAGFEAGLSVSVGIAVLTALGSRLLEPFTDQPAAAISMLARRGQDFRGDPLQTDLYRLAGEIRHTPALYDWLESAAPDFSGYPDQAPPALVEKITGLLARHGDRGQYETDVGWPRYAEDPSPLLNLLLQFARSEAGPAAERQAGPVLSAGGIQRLLPWRLWLARWLARRLRRYLSLREELYRLRGQAMTACRRWDLSLGERWVALGWLNRPEEIFWLTAEEVERGLLAGAEVGLTLPATVRARQDTYQTHAATPMPFVLTESQIPLLRPGEGLVDTPSAEVLVGLPISPGQARGRARIVRHPSEVAEAIDRETILVLPSTDPALLPLLHLAGGLVVETGGLLSHGSVIAREYGLPAVANIPQATRRFRTGDLLLIDGSTGVVQVIESTGG